MKLVSAVTALVAAFAVGTEAVKKQRVSRRELNQRMKNGNVNKATLMRGAKPHSAEAKKRALENQQFEISGMYSIQFESCFSLTTSYNEVFEDNDNVLMSMFSQGTIKPLESYAIFKLCYGDNCSGSSLSYVVDLDTYVQSLIDYLPDQMEGFCEACKENAETCQAMLYGGQYGNYGNRKLSEFEKRMLGDNQIVRQLNCNLCAEYNCLDDDDNNNESGFEDASEWLEDITGCKETGISYQGGYQNANGQYYQQQNDDDGAELFAGIICNGDGTGIEVGMFYDDECKVYLPNEAYSNYMSYYDSNYQAMTKEIIEFTFSKNVFSCKEEEIVYTVYDVSDYNGQYQNNNYDQDYGVSEYCQNLFEGDEYAPVDMSTCSNGNYNNYNNAGNYYDKYENYNEQYENYNQQKSYDWYSYEISEDDALNLAVVCSTAKKLDGQLNTYYNTANGSIYSYSGSSSAADDFMDVIENESIFKKGLSAGATFGIVALAGLLIGAGAALYMKFKASSGDDNKNVGLIDPPEPVTEFEAA